MPEKAVLLGMLAIAAMLSPVRAHAADGIVVEATDPAAVALARYEAGLPEIGPWSLETIEIEASLPGQHSRGKLRAIRRLLLPGKPEYRVLEMAGDSTVRHQVIFRYLSADSDATAMPAASIAVTPANYKFRYHGAVKTGGATAYCFLITPIRKRDGLIKGELWIDSETGAVVRQAGYFVKNPSIFVKRIAVTRETVLRGGIAAERVTHLSIDTRLVGRAELTVHERPFTDPAPAIEEE